MNFYVVHVEDPNDAEAPYKAFLIVAPDEATARAYTPAGMPISNIEVKTVGLPPGPPIRCAWVGGKYPLVGGW